ncbi:GNAT family N-acetyltransferase [Peribacillus sp. SI8-4]|uniref:GNAT family N-acetyltransferase n=1 Tax=Peribacillus sp. SI8-4 TaxID=3048009 RepID=UPI00255609BD|nr:GNAT family N-acetyltransferase [Peribacillus sp. SI8-4]
MKISQTKDFQLIAKLNEHVHDLHFRIYPEHFKEYDYEAVKAGFQSLIQNERFIFLLLEEDEAALGYAWIELREYPDTPFKKGYDSVYLHQISIGDAKRNKGYGCSLMKKVEEIASEKGVDVLELDYWSANLAAKEFYQKQGFKRYREFVYKKLQR